MRVTAIPKRGVSPEAIIWALNGPRMLWACEIISLSIKFDRQSEIYLSLFRLLGKYFS